LRLTAVALACAAAAPCSTSARAIFSSALRALFAAVGVTEMVRNQTRGRNAKAGNE
jgi:hypothetical protein